MTRAIRRFLLGRYRGPGLPDRRESDLTHYVKSLKNLIASQRRGIGGDLLRADSRASLARRAKHVISLYCRPRKGLMSRGVAGNRRDLHDTNGSVSWLVLY